MLVTWPLSDHLKLRGIVSRKRLGRIRQSWKFIYAVMRQMTDVHSFIHDTWPGIFVSFHARTANISINVNVNANVNVILHVRNLSPAELGWPAGRQDSGGFTNLLPRVTQGIMFLFGADCRLIGITIENASPHHVLETNTASYCGNKTATCSLTCSQ